MDLKMNVKTRTDVIFNFKALKKIIKSNICNKTRPRIYKLWRGDKKTTNIKENYRENKKYFTIMLRKWKSVIKAKT